MRLQVLGVKLVKGTAKASGNAFSMCRLFAMVPIENGGSEKVQVSGAGFELTEVELDQAALPEFLKLSYPLQLDLTTDSRPFRGKLEMIVTGFAPVVRKVA